MTVAVSTQLLDSLANLPEDKRADFMALIAGTTEGLSVSDISETLEKRKGAAEKRAANAARRAERDRKRKALEGLKVSVLEAASAMDFDTMGELLPEVTANGGKVVFTGVDDRGDPIFTLEGLEPKGGKGGKRPKDTDPQPYRDRDGERVIGPVTRWVKDNYPEDFEGLSKDGKPLQGFIKKALKAGVLTESPL